jgi:hypothetical protein
MLTLRLFDRMLSLVRFPLLVVILVLLALQTIIAGVPIQNTLTRIQGDGGQANQTKIQADIAELPLSFIANAGQADANVRFMVKAGKQTIFFTSQEIVFAASEQAEGEDTRSSVVRLRFAGANEEVKVEGEKPLPGVANFFLGNDPEKWRTDVPTYAAITYQNLYPGIGLIYSGKQGRLKSEFIVAAGADPTVITMDYGGASDMYVREDGALVLETPIGKLVEAPPVIYQMIDEERVTVEGGYHLLGEGEVVFILDDYVSTEPLIIDPTLVYSTYLGGSSREGGCGITVDDVGNVYLAGATISDDFPTETPLPQPSGSGHWNAFVAKLDASGTALVYCTYLGGSGGDYGRGIAVDAERNAYVIGETGSTDFPTKNPFQADPNSIFVTKLDSNGSSLVYSTYLGGEKRDLAGGLAVDSEGCAYIVGTTFSDAFPVRNAFQSERAGDEDAFVVKLTESGSDLAYATYLGGQDYNPYLVVGAIDRAYAIAVDEWGNAFVTGLTTSQDFPLENPFQTECSSYRSEAFVTQLNASGSGLIYSTYLGGEGSEEGRSIAVDEAGCAYITGYTKSVDFPTQNPLQPDHAGGYYDAFVAKLNASGSGLVYSTYLGGGADDEGHDIVVDGSGNAYITGYTMSGNFPTQDPVQLDHGGGGYPDIDAFVVKLNASGSALIYSTYVGGSNGESGYGIAVDDVGNAYITGETYSSDFPTQDPLQPDCGGHADVFVAKIGEGAVNQTPIADAGPDQTVIDTDGDGQEEVTLDGSGSYDLDGTIVCWGWKLNGTAIMMPDTPTVVALVIGEHTITLEVTDDLGARDTDVVVQHALWSLFRPGGRVADLLH